MTARFRYLCTDLLHLALISGLLLGAVACGPSHPGDPDAGKVPPPDAVTELDAGADASTPDGGGEPDGGLDVSVPDGGPADAGPFSPLGEVALWIPASMPGLPVDLSGDAYATWLMEIHYKVVPGGSGPVVQDVVPALGGASFVSAYPPGVTRERHLVTYGAGAPNSDQLLADPVALAKAIAAHYATVASLYGGLDLDIENFTQPGRVQNYATFVQALRPMLPAGAQLHITAQHWWATDPGVAALVRDGVADNLNVMFYDYSGPWTAPGPIAPLNWVQNRVPALLSAGIPAKRLTLGIPEYHYDWCLEPPCPSFASSGSVKAALDKAARLQTESQTVSAGSTLSIEPAVVTQRLWDPVAKELKFEYVLQGKRHVVHSPNARSTSWKLDYVATQGLRGVAVWNLRMVRENPPVQQVLLAWRQSAVAVATDPRPSEFLFRWSATHGTLSADATDGTAVSWTSPSAPASTTVTLAIEDGAGLSTNRSVVLTVQ